MQGAGQGAAAEYAEAGRGYRALAVWPRSLEGLSCVVRLAKRRGAGTEPDEAGRAVWGAARQAGNTPMLLRAGCRGPGAWKVLRSWCGRP